MGPLPARDIATKDDLRRLERKLLRWILGMALFQTALLAAALAWLSV